MTTTYRPFIRTLLVILGALVLAPNGMAPGQEAVTLDPITDMSVRRAVVSVLTSFPEEAVTAIAFLPDESLLVCGTGAGRVVTLALDDGRLVDEIGGHAAAVTSISVSPDGQWLASSGEDGWVHVASLVAEEDSFSLRHEGVVHEVEFSPKGTYLAAVGDFQDIRWWTTATWEEMSPIQGHTGPVRALAFSPAEDLLVTGAGDSDPSIRLWEVATGTELQHDLYEGTVYDIEYSPRARDRHATISGTQRTIWLWEVDRGEFLHVVGRFEQAVNDAAYASLGNALVAVSEDGTLFFTTMPSWTEKRRLSFDEELLAVAYAPSRR